MQCIKKKLATVPKSVYRAKMLPTYAIWDRDVYQPSFSLQSETNESCAVGKNWLRGSRHIISQSRTDGIRPQWQKLQGQTLVK